MYRGRSELSNVTAGNRERVQEKNLLLGRHARHKHRIAAALDNFSRAEMILQIGSDQVRLFRHQVEAAAWSKQAAAPLDEQAGDGVLSVIGRVRQDDIEALFGKSLDAHSGNCFKLAKAVGPGVELGQRHGADIAVNQSDATAWAAVPGGKDAVSSTTAADVQDAIAGADLHGFDQGAGAFIEAAVGEDTRSRKKM